MCDFYVSEKHDTVEPGWRKAYRVVLTHDGSPELQGPYQPFYASQDTDAGGRTFYWAERVHSPDYKYRHGFHGFCVFDSPLAANAYARFIRHRDGLFGAVVEVEVSGVLKRAEVEIASYPCREPALRVVLAEKIRECLPNV